MAGGGALVGGTGSAAAAGGAAPIWETGPGGGAFHATGPAAGVGRGGAFVGGCAAGAVPAAPPPGATSVAVISFGGSASVASGAPPNGGAVPPGGGPPGRGPCGGGGFPAKGATVDDVTSSPTGPLPGGLALVGRSPLPAGCTAAPSPETPWTPGAVCGNGGAAATPGTGIAPGGGRPLATGCASVPPFANTPWKAAPGGGAPTGGGIGAPPGTAGMPPAGGGKKDADFPNMRSPVGGDLCWGI
mmetsp:Transcript_109268/g.308281  ORF Transcript_109268/g.308281 Transcript_109268/m.308281 type:complete len:244 (-) Transcript_109268:2048-2779(-)